MRVRQNNHATVPLRKQNMMSDCQLISDILKIHYKKLELHVSLRQISLKRIDNANSKKKLNLHKGMAEIGLYMLQRS